MHLWPVIRNERTLVKEAVLVNALNVKIVTQMTMTKLNVGIV